MGKRKTCERCGKRPAEVPDRNRPWDSRKRICRACHAERLRGDMREIVKGARSCPACDDDGGPCQICHPIINGRVVDMREYWMPVPEAQPEQGSEER